MTRPNRAGSLILPSTRTIASVGPFVTRPAGTSWFAAWIAATTWSMPIDSAVSAFGLTSTRICRVTRPWTSMRATPGTFSRPLTIVCSVSEVSSRSRSVGESTATDTTGCLFSSSIRSTSGSLTSRGKPGRTCAILSRTSCMARIMPVAMRNSANTSLLPPREFERISLTPETVLIAYSSGLVTSASTTSGDAPG
jgi:hypothetical protein